MAKIAKIGKKWQKFCAGDLAKWQSLNDYYDEKIPSLTGHEGSATVCVLVNSQFYGQ